MTGVVVLAALFVRSSSVTVVVITTELTTLPPVADGSGRT